MSLHSGKFDDDRIAYEAFLTIQRDFYTNPPKNIPEFRPFKNPEVFDINKTQYESPVLCMIIDAVRHVFREILQQQYPGQFIHGLSCPSHELKRISWKVFGLLRLAPVRERDKNDKIIARYDPVRYHDHFGEEGHLDMTHNRILAFEKKSAQERLEKLHNALLDILGKRYRYLEDLFSACEDQEKESVMAHIERCMQEVAPIQRDIHALCQLFELPNQLLPIEPEESSSFSQIVHWNYIQRQERARQEFELSESEGALLPFVPPSFRETEWPLFQFTFVPPEEIEEHNASESGTFQEDIQTLRERLLERKMMIGYYILHQLALHRHKRITLDPQHITFLTQTLEKLSIEIDLLRRKLMNKKGKEVHIKNHLSEIDDLMTSMQNVLQIPKIDPVLSGILEGIMGVMHTFYTNCNQVYRDSMADPLEVEGIIETFRSDALERLEMYESRILELEISSPIGESTYFHRVVDVMHRSISFLRGE